VKRRTGPSPRTAGGGGSARRRRLPDRQLYLAPRRRQPLVVGSRPLSLLTELDAFYTEHRRCGELEAGVEGRWWMACSCGATVARHDSAARRPLRERPPARSWGRSGSGRQAHGERAARAWAVARRLYGTAVKLDKTTDDSQSDPQACPSPKSSRTPM
jgi:hypothetical protein